MKRKRTKNEVNRAALPRQVGAFDNERIPFAGSSNLPASFLDETIEFWQPRTKRTLTREDAREIVQNLAGFFGVLKEWDDAKRLATKRRDKPAQHLAVRSQSRHEINDYHSEK